MEQKYLIINLGSSSKRYAIFQGNKKIFELHQDLNISNTRLKDILNLEIDAIAIRVVAPGSYFTENKLVDNNYLKRLKQAEKKAELHIKPVTKELEFCKRLLPNIPIVAVSDSKFHSSLPEVSKIYAIDKKDAKKFDIYRFGYHGISCQSIINKIKQESAVGAPKIPENIIICHLGSGSSVTAIKNGKSFDTSMGFTPLEGLPMMTRVGNIDPAAILYLKKNISYFSKKCGLYGISGYSDMRKILNVYKSDTTAKLALDLYVTSVKKYIGSYIALLGKLDLLIFTGAIGENSEFIRKKICENFELFGINKILVYKTEEMLQIYSEAKLFLEK